MGIRSDLCLAITRQTFGVLGIPASPAEPFAACGSGYTPL